MTQINAAEILDFAMSGTSATLLARRWESALLVNVDNETLQRLMVNKEAMEALMRIEGFDEGSVHVGTKVFHKAFGHGTITELGGGKLRVSFNGELKPFLFPAAFLQGFLKVEEN